MTNHLKYVSFEFLWNVYELLSIMTLNFRQRDDLIEKISFHSWMTYILYTICICMVTINVYLRIKQMAQMSFLWYVSDFRSLVCLGSGCAIFMECKWLRQAFNVWAEHLVGFVFVITIKYLVASEFEFFAFPFFLPLNSFWAASQDSSSSLDSFPSSPLTFEFFSLFFCWEY